MAREKLSEINAAYEVLKDSNRRAAYDRERRVYTGAPPASSGPVATPPDLGAMVRSFVRLIVVFAIVFFALRFIRNPKALLVIGAAILIAWFLPRFLTKLKRPK